jgi:hypothetical protein
MPGTAISVVDHLDLFVTDKNGAIYSAYWSISAWISGRCLGPCSA